MKSLNCWFRSKDDKSMFQERIPVRERETKRALDKVRKIGLQGILSSSQNREEEGRDKDSSHGQPHRCLFKTKGTNEGG